MSGAPLVLFDGGCGHTLATQLKNAGFNLDAMPYPGLGGKGLKRTRKFAQKTFRMGEGQEFRWDKALAVADAIEDAELTRRLTLRK